VNEHSETTGIVERMADEVLTVTISRPDRSNALTPGMISELRDILHRVAADQQVRALVLTGAGPAFCSGIDLGEAKIPQPLSLMQFVTDLVMTLHQLPKPTIARVRGPALGLGCNLALACDFVIADSSASFGQIFVRRGLVIDGGGSWLLPRFVGLRKAKELALLGDQLEAYDAASLGMINRVVSPENLDSTVSEWAQRLRHGPTLALGLTKALLNQGAASSLDASLHAEGTSQAAIFQSKDAAEGVRAFAQRREPVFRGM